MNTTIERINETLPIIAAVAIIALYVVGFILLPYWVMALITALGITAFFTLMIVGFHYAQNRAFNSGFKDTDDKG